MKSFLFFILLVQQSFSQNIMFVPANVDYSNSQKLSIASDLFDEFNSVVVDINIKNKDKNITTFNVIQGLMPNTVSQKTITKFYDKHKKTKTSYLKKLSSFYNLDVLVFHSIGQNKKKKHKINFYVYKSRDNNTTTESIKLKFDKNIDSFNEKDLEKLKEKLTINILN